MSTPDVEVIECPNETVLSLTLTLVLELNDARRLTGLHHAGDIAKWLAAKIHLLDDMLNDSNARDSLLGYLESYAQDDRKDGALPR